MNAENITQNTLRDLMYILFKHKAKIITISLTVVFAATIGIFRLPTAYKASSKIMLKFGRENIYIPVGSADGGGSSMLVDASRKERLNSAIEMLRARSLIEKVVSDLGAEKIYPKIVTEKTTEKNPLFSRSSSRKISPIEKATLMFEKELGVEAVENSDIITIKFSHEDPVIAAQAVNKLIDIFIEHHLRVYKQPQQYDFFGEQVILQEEKLRKSENELKAFREKNNIVSLEEQKSLLLRQIADMETGLATTRADISEKQGMIRALTGEGDANGADGKMGEETEFNRSAMSAIRGRLAELQMEEEKLLSKYKEQSIPVVNLRKEIKKAQELLAEEEKTYHDKAVTSLNHTVKAIVSKENRQQRQLIYLKQELVRINSLELKHRGLERQVALNEGNYQLYVKNMEEARISNAMDNQKIVNISVVEPANPPLRPVNSNKRLTLFLAIIVGGVTGLGAAFSFEYFNQSFSRVEDVTNHLNLPVLASIPEMK
jgi:uncharacterized protein involved in exopolysaccharide biosynthesis